MRRVVWSIEALANLGRIVSYIEDFNPPAAQRLAERIKRSAMSLADQPDRGRAVSARLRELTIMSPYIIRYRVEAEAVVIVRIRHGARRPTK